MHTTAGLANLNTLKDRVGSKMREVTKYQTTGHARDCSHTGEDKPHLRTLTFLLKHLDRRHVNGTDMGPLLGTPTLHSPLSPV